MVWATYAVLTADYSKNTAMDDIAGAGAGAGAGSAVDAAVLMMELASTTNQCKSLNLMYSPK